MRVLIVEDEAVIARRLERLIRQILGDRLSWLKVADSLGAALRQIETKPIDLLMLDLDLHGEDGFELQQQALAASLHTVVVSAHIDRAITAFEYGVLDFVPKPFDRERLKRAFARFEDAASRADHGLRYLSLVKHGRIELLAIGRVRYIKGAGPYAELFLDDGRTELYSKSLDRLMMILPPSFERIHKSYIVNMNRARCIRTRVGSRYELELEGRVVLPVGRTRVRRIRQKLLDGPRGQ